MCKKSERKREICRQKIFLYGDDYRERRVMKRNAHIVNFRDESEREKM